MKSSSVKFKQGEWVWYEHKLVQIKKITEGRVTEVTDGYISSGFHDLSDDCFPMDIRAKLVSEEYDASYKKLRKEAGNLNLNYPDIHRLYVSEWKSVMEERHDDKAIADGYARLRAFEKEFTDAIERSQSAQVAGVSLFRR
jgi:hypothetical protein